MHQSRETCIYRGAVTSRYKKYRPPILVGLLGFSDGLVTTFLVRFVGLQTYSIASITGEAISGIQISAELLPVGFRLISTIAPITHSFPYLPDHRF